MFTAWIHYYILSEVSLHLLTHTATLQSILYVLAVSAKHKKKNVAAEKKKKAS